MTCAHGEACISEEIGARVVDEGDEFVGAADCDV
jgi:hypothetical protein